MMSIVTALKDALWGRKATLSPWLGHGKDRDALPRPMETAPHGGIAHDAIKAAGEGSFPASDPPGFSPGVALHPQAYDGPEVEIDLFGTAPVEVSEHPLSDPSSRSRLA